MSMVYNPREYYPIDLVWEGTRRNEEYKRNYRAFAKADDGSLWYNGRWRIYPKLIDPSLSIRRIKERIAAGERFDDVHPYWRDFARVAVIEHHLPMDSHCADLRTCDRTGKDLFRIESPRQRPYYCIPEEEITGRIYLDPL